MKEVEIKAKLVNRDQVMEKLRELGCAFEPAVTQDDIVYTKNVGSLKEFRNNEVYLRLRVKNSGTSKEKILFTLKKRMANDLDAIEHEVTVDSKEEMEQALFLMGYKEAIRISKTRVATTHEGREIVIDDVVDLGAFIEMETLTESGDSEKIQEEMFQFFETLGIKREDRCVSGYDVLTFQKQEGI